MRIAIKKDACLNDFTLDNVPELENINLCLGFFDGIHLGHKHMIQKALNEGYKVAALTFSNNPSYVIGKTITNEFITNKLPVSNTNAVDKIF